MNWENAIWYVFHGMPGSWITNHLELLEAKGYPPAYYRHQTHRGSIANSTYPSYLMRIGFTGFELGPPKSKEGAYRSDFWGKWQVQVQGYIEWILCTLEIPNSQEVLSWLSNFGEWWIYVQVTTRAIEVLKNRIKVPEKKKKKKKRKRRRRRRKRS